MKDYATDAIRNVALISHGGGGKTSLGEALLFHTGAVNRMGKIEEGNTVSDFEDEEIRRRLSLSTSVLALEYKDHKVNLLDTPGYTDFIGEVISALRASDAAVLLVELGRRGRSGHRAGLGLLRDLRLAALRGHQQDGP